MLNSLTPKAEELLNEILEHKDEKGNYSSEYWIKKFDEFSMAEDDLCRSCFKELADNDLVTTRWADNAPYYITVSSKGLSYFDMKKKAESEKKKEKRDSRWHDILIAAIGAIFGGIVTFALFKLFGIG